ncbi:MAG: hypothetical protein ACRC1M_00085 [Methanobacteriaceae archaeon]
MSIDSKINSGKKSQTCDLCGATVEIDAIFCSGCGSALNKVKQNNIGTNNNINNNNVNDVDNTSNNTNNTNDGDNGSTNFNHNGIVSKIYNLNSRINLLAVIIGIIAASLASLAFSILFSLLTSARIISLHIGGY